MVKLIARSIKRLYGKYKATLTVRIAGTSVTFNTAHPVAKSWFYPRYLLGRLHEPGITQLVAQEFSPGDIFYDVGANLGWFTLIATRLCRQGEVHAFEVDPRLTGLMLDSLAMNEPGAACYVNNVAVTGGNYGLVSFAPNTPGNPSTNQVTETGKTRNSVNVGAISLDQYCRDGNAMPSIVKIDIEGGEDQALRGMKEVLERAKPRLILEIHPEQLREQAVEPGQMIADILEAVPDYDVWRIAAYRQRDSASLERYDSGTITWGSGPEVLFLKVREHQ